jgi:hypothetical protein
MLSNTEAACVTIALALCVKRKEKASPLDQRMVQYKDHNTYMKIS